MQGPHLLNIPRVGAGKLRRTFLKKGMPAIRRALKQIATRAGLQRAVWRLSLPHEMKFWDSWFASKGGKRPEDYHARFDPEKPLQPNLARLLERTHPSGPVRILDVGAGPLTILGKKLGGREVTIVAVDPLADFYDSLLARHGIQPLVRTRKCAGEDLRAVFDENQFDLAYAHNCLDHSFDALRCIREMVAVVKPGHAAAMTHFESEAVRENYKGLHQWNFFRGENGHFCISSARETVDVTEELASAADVTCSVSDGLIYCEIVKASAKAA